MKPKNNGKLTELTQNAKVNPTDFRDVDVKVIDTHENKEIINIKEEITIKEEWNDLPPCTSLNPQKYM